MLRAKAGLNSFEQAGFVRSNSEVRRRLIMAVDGPEKSGKSHFALSAPEPIGVINFDIGLEGVVEKWQSDKEIWVKDIRFSIEDFRRMDPKKAAGEADRILQDIWRAYRAILGEAARSIVLDNATELWELVRLSHFGKLDQVKSHHYVHPNSEMREFIRMAYDQGNTNLILLHKVKDEYVDGERTGAKSRAGFSDTGFLVQCNAYCWRDMTEPNVPDCFHMEIVDCRQDPSLAGCDINGAELTFPAIAAMIFPSTTEEDWL